MANLELGLEEKDVTASELQNLKLNYSGTSYIACPQELFITEESSFKLTEEEYVQCLDKFTAIVNNNPDLKIFIISLVEKEGKLSKVNRAFGFGDKQTTIRFAVEELKKIWIRGVGQYITAEEINEHNPRSKIDQAFNDVKINCITKFVSKIYQNEDLPSSLLIQTSRFLGPDGFNLKKQLKNDEWGGYSVQEIKLKINSLYESNNITDLEDIINASNLFLESLTYERRYNQLGIPNSSLRTVVVIEQFARELLEENGMEFAAEENKVLFEG